MVIPQRYFPISIVAIFAHLIIFTPLRLQPSNCCFFAFANKKKSVLRFPQDTA